jgi:hypothetical protein
MGMKKASQWALIIVSLIAISGLVYFITTKKKYMQSQP